jgi:transcriptional regulator with XRE-family HTH domain
MRRREGMTQKVLSQKADIPQGHISEMERGKMKIGVVVPRDRIELPTRGFSVPCSTD